MIAIPWYFTAVLGYQSLFGILYGVLAILSTIWSIYAGMLTDRYNRKKILITYSIIGGLLMSFAAASQLVSMIPLWLVSAVVFSFTALLFNIHYTNIYSFAQEITPQEEYNKVISQLEVQGQFTTILGGVLAAVLMEGTVNHSISILGLNLSFPFQLAPWSLYQIFGLDALTYFIAVLILGAIRYQPGYRQDTDKESAWQRIQVGWNYLWSKPFLLIFSWASTAVFVSVLLISFFLMPSYISLVLSEKSHVFAFSELFFALGALLAGFFARFFLSRWHEVNRILFLFGIALIVFLVFIFNTKLTWFYLANIFFGFSNAAIRYNRVSFLWKIIPNYLMGRVSAVISTSSYVLRAFWGFIFSLPLFTGKSGMIYVMMTLLFFILISGIFILYHSSGVKQLKKT